MVGGVSGLRKLPLHKSILRVGEAFQSILMFGVG
jgi:hypothetical protein